MVRLFRLHKFAGLWSGGILLLLALTGFLLDHDNWRFLYGTTLTPPSQTLLEQERRLFEGYRIDSSNPSHRIACGKRGIYESHDGGGTWERDFEGICLALRESGDGTLFAATDNGIWKRIKGRWSPVALEGAYVNALALHDHEALASVEKHRLYRIDLEDGRIVGQTEVAIPREELQESITLARFVRDLHYGRGLLEGDLSLLINDYGALLLLWLALSGYIIWRRIAAKRGARGTRTLIRTHGNIFAVVAALPLLILALTGIFLDHARALGPFMKSVTIPHTLLPPVYGTLTHDIWSLDYDGERFRVGNRYGVYVSDDMKEWRLENRGFAYRMFRTGDALYVSGMGAPNRILTADGWHPLPHTPHMFKDLLPKPDGMGYFSTHRPVEPLPTFETVTLYTLLMSLHDGTFFASWWVWVNDAAAVALLLLLLTGTLRWWAKRRGFRPPR
ncbi:PepSY domain-containing protein [Hydrogenimonas sp.]